MVQNTSKSIGGRPEVCLAGISTRLYLSTSTYYLFLNFGLEELNGLCLELPFVDLLPCIHVFMCMCVRVCTCYMILLFLFS